MILQKNRSGGWAVEEKMDSGFRDSRNRASAFGGVAGIQLVQRYMPSKNQADIGELLGITDDASQAAIYLNGELQEEKGLVDGEQMYLPVTWVDEYVNEKFYWDVWRKCWYISLPVPSV